VRNKVLVSILASCLSLAFASYAQDTDATLHDLPSSEELEKEKLEALKAEAGRSDINSIVIAEVIPIMPDHAPYVKDDGTFDIRSAARDIFDRENGDPSEAFQRAQIMSNEWLEAYNSKSTEVQSRLVIDSNTE